MKTLIVYYSRTGTTKKIAEAIAQKIGADTIIEEIKDTVDRAGAKGYLISGRDATLRRLTTLQPAKYNPADFDLVIIGTPIWSWNLSAPVRTYVTEHGPKFKKVAFFCTMGGSGDERAFKEMAEIIGKKPTITLALKTREVIGMKFLEKIADFASKLA